MDELQFGFVPGMGYQKALFTLDSVVNYYTSHGCPVFVASLDATKACDRVNHNALVHKLLPVDIPIALLSILMCWFLNFKDCILWCDAFSPLFCINRQEEIISPWLFNEYINDLISRIRISGFGCYVLMEFVGKLFFCG